MPARDPDELEKAMSRIEDEAARMGVLVDELLTLARLDEVRQRRAPARRPGDGRGRGVRRRAGGEPRPHHRAGRGIESGGDRRPGPAPPGGCQPASQRRPSTRPAAARSTCRCPRGRDVTLAVRDHGEGLPPGAAEHAFERFCAPRARARSDDGGAGLGLAIVAAIAEAHGGRAVASDAPGGGAVFEVVLPRGEPRSSTRENGSGEGQSGRRHSQGDPRGPVGPYGREGVSGVE